jgi:hypothetical protein
MYFVIPYPPINIKAKNIMPNLPIATSEVKSDIKNVNPKRRKIIEKPK